MIYKLQQSSKTNGIPLTFETKEDTLNAISVLIGNLGLHRLTLSWEPEQPDEVKTTYPEQECAITDHPPLLEKMPDIEKDRPISSIEEIKPKPAPKKRGRPEKQTALTKKDDDANYRKILDQDTKPHQTDRYS